MVHRTAALEGAHGIGLGRRAVSRAPGAIGFLRDLPDDSVANVHSNRAAERIVSGDPELALEHLKEALRLAPEDAVHHNRMGMALKHLGRIPEAQAAFDDALSYEPGLASALYNKACLQALAGHIPEALLLLGEAFPARPELFIELASLDPDLRRLQDQPGFHELVARTWCAQDHFDS